MAKKSQLQRQIAKILDQATKPEVEVIVQMESGRAKSSRLNRAVAEALSRRIQTQSPRDILPKHYDIMRLSREIREKTASTRTLLGQSAVEEVAFKIFKKEALEPLDTLFRSDVVRKALGRIFEPERKSEKVEEYINTFWTSRSMPLRFRKNELSKLPDEVDNIKSIHINRKLSVPSLVETSGIPTGTEVINRSSWGIEKIKALSVWGAYKNQGKGVTIGLLDTGVDASHPDIEGKIKHWAEFDSRGQQVEGSTPHDTDQHGTHCAGTLVGLNSSGRFIGVAPEAKLAAALVLNGAVGGTDAQVLAGIDWAVEKRVDVISLSLGGLVMDPETPPTYTEAILTCIERGIPVIAAIGNEGEQTTGSPGNDLFATGVGAIDQIDRVAGFSGGRTQIIRESGYILDKYLPLVYMKPDLSAPGVAIYSSVPNGDWKSFSGTSMATPHVAGAIALLLSNTTIKPKEAGARRAYTIKDLICGSVEDLGEAGQEQRYGFGRLDVLRAIDFAWQRGYPL